MAGAHGEDAVINVEQVEHKEEQGQKPHPLHVVDPVLIISRRLARVTETVARTGGPRTVGGVPVGQVIRARALREVCACMHDFCFLFLFFFFFLSLFKEHFV